MLESFIASVAGSYSCSQLISLLILLSHVRGGEKRNISKHIYVYTSSYSGTSTDLVVSILA